MTAGFASSVTSVKPELQLPKTRKPGAEPPWVRARALRTDAAAGSRLLLRRPLGNDLHLDGPCDAAMQLDRHVDLADPLDRVVELELAPIDVEAFREQRFGDIGRGHRPVERFGLADLARDDDLEIGEPRRHRVGDLLLLELLRFELD